MSSRGPSAKEQELITKMLEFKYDPVGFAYYAFPWGKENTPLAQMDGPRGWQLDDLQRIRDHLQLDREKQRIGLGPSPLYLARSSGRGIGKSAELAMLNMWAMSCWLGATCIVTANTEAQLRTRTMAELGKWHTMAINRHWFEKSATSLKPARWFSELLGDQLAMDTQYYYVDAQSWSAENPDAFAGAHSQVGMMVQFDEASGIDDSIWNVTEGFFTDLAPMRLWIAISNPRRNTGRFFDCFHNDSGFWDTKSIDSRTVEGVDAQVYQRIADKYGEDHDVTRVEVKGEFPRTGSQQFYSQEKVDESMSSVRPTDSSPLVMGVDVARFGDDSTVFAYRRGRDGRFQLERHKGLDTMAVVREVARRADERKPRVIFVDEIGIGAGVVDRLKQLGYPVIGVNVGRRAEREEYGNKRIELYGRMRDWLDEGGALPSDKELRDELLAIEYHFTGPKQFLESKENMKSRGLPSPDAADAFVLTFAERVAGEDVMAYRRRRHGTATTDFAWTV